MEPTPFGYDAELPLEGESAKALDTARAILVAAGFQVRPASGDGLLFTGPGLNSTRQNPLLGATRIRLVPRDGRLRVRAELGGARRLGRFVRFFPPALCLGLAVLLSSVFWVTQPGLEWMPTVYATTGGLGIGWLLIGPWFAGGIRQNTRAALDAFAASVARAS